MGKKTGPGQAAQHGEQQRRREDERLRDQEQLDVDPERVRDLGERLAVQLPVEEVRLELVPPGRARDREDHEADEDDRGEDGDRDRPRLLRDVDGRAAEDA